MRVRLKGLHWTNKRLADGRAVRYYYAWRGGPKLAGEPGSPEFVRQYNEAVNSRKRPAEGLMFTLISEFKASAEFQGRSPSTKRAYHYYFKLIEDEFGDMPIEAIAEVGARKEFKRWRDTFASTPRKADYAWAVLARILSYATDNERIPHNPCKDAGRLYASSRADKVWGEAELGKLLSVASAEVRLGVILALWTGQRQGDLLRLRWSDYDGKYIRLKQGKTGRAVTIPVSKQLKAELEATGRYGPLIMTTQRGNRPWTGDGFRASWAKTLGRAKVEGLTFHDLRGSAVTRLALAGATVAEIASITGHALRDASAILERHYLGTDMRLAESAIRKLERKEKRTKASNQSQTGSR